MDKEKLMTSIKNSVGYTESSNKSIFLVGASVATDWVNEYWESKYKNLSNITDSKDREIEHLNKKLNALKSALQGILDY